MRRQIILKALEVQKQEVEKEIAKFKKSLRESTLTRDRFQKSIDICFKALCDTCDPEDIEQYKFMIEDAMKSRDNFQSWVEHYSEELKVQEEEYKTVVDMIKTLQRRNKVCIV